MDGARVGVIIRPVQERGLTRAFPSSTFRVGGDPEPVVVRLDLVRRRRGGKIWGKPQIGVLPSLLLKQLRAGEPTSSVKDRKEK